jgi:acyl carrier protein
MNTTEFLNELEKELGVISGSIKPDEIFRDTKYWDSLSEIALLSLVEDKLGIKISPTHLKQIETVQDLITWSDSANK